MPDTVVVTELITVLRGGGGNFDVHCQAFPNILYTLVHHGSRGLRHHPPIDRDNAPHHRESDSRSNSHQDIDSSTAVEQGTRQCFPNNLAICARARS